MEIVKLIIELKKRGEDTSEAEKTLTPQQRWRVKNYDRHKSAQKDWRENNPDKKRGYARKGYLKAKEQGKVYEYYIKREYNLTPEELSSLKDIQKGLCALCLEPPPEGILLHIDHDHLTGEVRGLLCQRCNKLLAGVDRVEWLAQAIDYVLGEGDFEYLSSWRKERVSVRK